VLRTTDTISCADGTQAQAALPLGVRVTALVPEPVDTGVPALATPIATMLTLPLK
jgi:hypothetical protein